jgi:hypothetical protein
MNTDFIKLLAKELATKLNALINIPFIKEEDEQVFFELVVNIVLGAVLANFDKLNDKKS